MTTELPIFSGDYDVNMLSNLPINDYFKNNHPSAWHPIHYANNSDVYEYVGFEHGLITIGKQLSSPCVFARRWLKYLSTKSGKILKEQAEGLFELKLAAIKNQITFSNVQAKFSTKTFASPSAEQNDPVQPKTLALSSSSSQVRITFVTITGKRKWQGDIEDPQPRSMTSTTMPNPFLSEDDAWQDFAYFTSFGQASTWTHVADGPDAIDYLSLFKEYRTAQKTSLALDMVADVSTSGSESGTFTEWIRKKYGYAGLRNVRYRAPTSTAIKDIWPTFETVMERIFAPDVVSYDDVCRSVAKEPDQLDPLVTYCSAVLRSYMHHFTFSSTVRKDINEREAFVDFTWCFIRSALTIAKIPSRMLEVQMDGSKDRKVETKHKGTRQNTPRRADGVGLYNDNQIYVAEAGQVYGATLEKKEEDAWKVKRAMRDSWVSQLRRICETHRPTSPLVVFGSTSHLHTTKFYAMDFVGCFRVSVLSSMVVPLSSDDFADKMKACMLTCLNFVRILLAEIESRKKATFMFDQEEKEELLELVASIPATSTTPIKKDEK
ncbi:hypothetical protein BCR41DRAFT_354103 [Lobosporangium transversale]|uniref:Uncharacterized protein n=1 Tax=Lobosporangium transversale TaxID=64571 RepID=A0A1Y2GMK5_9FUNG|nr:hypothetical protein BCR41DRAFT_354103 [Lobosporangium transversale]ORZ15579.1 hypothetical protein BCR41DRAFT_354103 [Lobosporangium transversale]|eukprot:XP_021881327.1 hypothetical protein BCR41DRAFT_354103 [Lobosporangium transversale]